MTKLITIPRLAKLTGLSYRLCLHLVETAHIPSVRVGRRRRIDVRWVDQWLASGGYRACDEGLTEDRESAGAPTC
ncbi:MAG TPA: excisionase family DNA-binding protein [Bryobacteraceae bacterium]|jgi:excisionase family DNA binding protein